MEFFEPILTIFTPFDFNLYQITIKQKKLLKIPIY